MKVATSMELIKQVEIAYFRSIYKDDLNNCSGTNVIFGRNDAGKSNVLRALNLFLGMKLTQDRLLGLSVTSHMLAVLRQVQIMTLGSLSM